MEEMTILFEDINEVIKVLEDMTRGFKLHDKSCPRSELSGGGKNCECYMHDVRVLADKMKGHRDAI
jgi:hypothetical protein